MAGASIIRTPTHTFYTNYSQFTGNPFQLQKLISNFDAALKSNERFEPLLGLDFDDFTFVNQRLVFTNGLDVARKQAGEKHFFVGLTPHSSSHRLVPVVVAAAGFSHLLLYICIL